MITIAEIGRLKSILAVELAALRQPSEHLMFRENTDYLGRIADAHIAIDEIFDEFPASDLPLARAQTAYENFQQLAAICLAQLSFLRAAHPTLSQELPHGP